MLKPPVALMPGMEGGPTAKTRASGMAANLAFSAETMALEASSGDFRSSHGLSPMNPVPR